MSEAHEEHLVGVFEDEEQARAAAQAAGAGGQARVGDHGDRVASVRAEMRDEVEGSWVAPQGGFVLTKEMTKGLLVALPVWTLAGALIALPLAFVDFPGILKWTDMSLWVRLVTVILVGGFSGAVIGAIVGAGVAAQRPASKRLATERGVTVSVPSDSPQAAEALSRHDPIRVDRIETDGTPAAQVTTEDDRDGKGLAAEAGETAGELVERSKRGSRETEA